MAIDATDLQLTVNPPYYACAEVEYQKQEYQLEEPNICQKRQHKNKDIKIYNSVHN